MASTLKVALRSTRVPHAFGSASSGRRGAGNTVCLASKKAPAKKVVEEEEEEPELGIAGTAAVALGAVANPIALWSEYTLATTGAGLPPGPGGALGAAEGVSYLVVVGIAAWSVYTKVTTGKGLPAGPAGALGAVEGVTYLSLAAGIVAAGLAFVK